MKYTITNRIRTRLMSAGLILAAIALVNVAGAQTQYKAGTLKTTIAGTSNIHDWEMHSQKGTATAVVALNPSGGVASVSNIQFVLPAESLKSEHKKMDDNTYKALKTSKNPNISFAAGTTTLRANGANGFILNTTGKLTISGVTKDVNLVANGVVNADKSISFTGSYKLKMTEYKVDPPTAMLGAIKTGDGIEVKYNLILKAH